jgi:hypothetical protein
MDSRIDSPQRPRWLQIKVEKKVVSREGEMTGVPDEEAV